MDDANGYLNLALLGAEVNSVLEQVQQNLLESALICHYLLVLAHTLVQGRDIDTLLVGF